MNIFPFFTDHILSDNIKGKKQKQRKVKKITEKLPYQYLLEFLRL